MHQIALVGCSISLFRRRKQAVSLQPTRGENNISSGRVRRMFNSAHSLFIPWTDS